MVSMDAEQFVGLSKHQVYGLSEKLGLIPQLVRIDERSFLEYPEPENERNDRVYVEIDKGKVTQARIC